MTTFESALIPGWSPDGRWIAYLSDNDAFYVIPWDGSSAATQMTSFIPTMGAQWTPDSQRLMIAHEDGRVMLYDPSNGDGVAASWTAPSMPNWQRRAP